MQRYHVIGNDKLLEADLLAVFCSQKCPGSIILRTHDLAHKLKDKSVGVVSGFHSPIEQEMLTVLLRGQQPIVICPARGIQNYHVPEAWKPRIERGTLAVVSPFLEKVKRITVKTAQVRNQFVASLASKIVVAYAEPNSKTENFCKDLIHQERQILTFESEYTRNLQDLGAVIISVDEDIF